MPQQGCLKQIKTNGKKKENGDEQGSDD